MLSDVERVAQHLPAVEQLDHLLLGVLDDQGRIEDRSGPVRVEHDQTFVIGRHQIARIQHDAIARHWHLKLIELHRVPARSVTNRL